MKMYASELTVLLSGFLGHFLVCFLVCFGFRLSVGATCYQVINKTAKSKQTKVVFSPH